MIPKESIGGTDTSFTLEGVPIYDSHANRRRDSHLRAAERIELYKWLDHVVVADCGADTSFCSRLGVDRSLETPPCNR